MPSTSVVRGSPRTTLIDLNSLAASIVIPVTTLISERGVISSVFRVRNTKILTVLTEIVSNIYLGEPPNTSLVTSIRAQTSVLLGEGSGRAETALITVITSMETAQPTPTPSPGGGEEARVGVPVPT